MVLSSIPRRGQAAKVLNTIPWRSQTAKVLSSIPRRVTAGVLWIVTVEYCEETWLVVPSCVTVGCCE